MAKGVKRPDQTRAQITRAAADALAERGYDGVRVQDVARRAGMTTGAIYAHFPGRAALIAAAVESRTSSVVAELEEEGPLPQRLFDVALRLLADPEKTANPLEIEALVAARREPELASLLGARLDGLHDRVGGGIAAAQRRGEIAADIDARAAAYFCHALLLGLVLLDSATDQKPAPDEWESLVGAVVRGIVAGPAPPR